MYITITAMLLTVIQGIMDYNSYCGNLKSVTQV